jgi:hypothetical protein
MGGINVGRWIAGGIVAGVIMWVVEGAASIVYMGDMEAALEAHGLGMELTAGVMALTVVVSLVAGLVLVFLYVAARPRFGPGPKTAVIVAIAMWIGGYLLSLVGYQMIGLYPSSMLIMWGLIGLIEMIVASVVGGWVYREPGIAPTGVA